MLFLVPVIHAGEDFGGRADREDGAFRDHVQRGIRHHGGDFEDDIGIRVQARHFEVDPGEVVLTVVRVLHADEVS